MPTTHSLPIRRRLTTVAGLIAGAVGVVSLGLTSPAGAEPVAMSAPALQAQAADLAARIDALDEQLSVLAERYDQAQLVVAQADASLSIARVDAAEAEEAVARAEASLRGQAVSAYVNGGTRADASAVPHAYRLTAEEGIRRNYTRAAVDATQRAIDALHASQHTLTARQRAVAVAAGTARAALSRAQADRDAAASTEASQRALLAQVQGRLGALVRAEQARRAAEAAAAAKAAALARLSGAKAPAKPPTKPTGSPGGSTTTVPSGGSTPSSTTTTTAPAPVSPPPPSSAPLPAPNPTKANQAIAAAKAELGKPYEWGGAGPDTFDCSGLTAWAWKAAGVYLPHSALAQYQMLPFVPVDKLAPGDLVFYGSDIHHVGLYVGNGQMIEAAHTGTNIRYASIWRSDIVGGGRPT